MKNRWGSWLISSSGITMDFTFIHILRFIICLSIFFFSLWYWYPKVVIFNVNEEIKRFSFIESNKFLNYFSDAILLIPSTQSRICLYQLELIAILIRFLGRNPIFFFCRPDKGGIVVIWLIRHHSRCRNDVIANLFSAMTFLQRYYYAFFFPTRSLAISCT